MKVARFLFFIILVLLISENVVLAQRKGKISGQVIEKNTNLPIPFLTVFIKNSTKGTITNDQGYFNLENISQGSYELVFQHLSYETHKERINITSGKEIEIDVSMDLKTIDIDAVVKTPDFERWSKNFRTFKKIFLGSIANLSVRLKNPEDLFFYYNPETKLLSGYADKPLIIINKVLGYRITYYLDFFKYYEEDNYYTFTGSAFYENLKAGIFLQEINWRKNREACYKGSLMQFLRCLYDTTYIQSGYSVGGVIPAEDILNLGDTIPKTKLQENIIVADSLSALNQIKNIQRNVYRFFSDLPYSEYVLETENTNEKRLQFADVLNIGYGYSISGNYWNETASELTLNEDFIMFDRNGNIYPPLGLVSHGLFASKRNMRYLLPVDYYPVEKK